MAQHSKILSPSASERCLTCPGSVPMSMGLPDPGSSDAADEGSAAHELGALALREGKDCAAYIGRVFTEYPDWPVTDEMAEGVQVYVDYVRDRVAPGDTLLIETSLPHGDALGLPGETGTGDALIISPSRSVVIVIDLKFGRSPRGIVHAPGNSQVRCYMLGARVLADLLGFEEARHFEGRIVQPRLEHISSERLEVNELEQWRAETGNRVGRIEDAIKFVTNGGDLADSPYLVPGDHCRFCPGSLLAACPKLEQEIEDAYENDFDAVKGDEPGAPGSVRSATLGRLFAKLDRWSDFIKHVREAAYDDAMAGRPPDNTKLVAGRRGDRAWADGMLAEAVMKAAKIRKGDMYVSRIITAPEAEKKFKKTKPAVWKQLTPLIAQAEGKPSLVLASDPRPTLELTPTSEDFADIQFTDEPDGPLS